MVHIQAPETDPRPSNLRTSRPSCGPTPTDHSRQRQQHEQENQGRAATMNAKTAAKPKVTRAHARLTGLFSSGDAAERAFQACIDRGHSVGDVNVVVSEGTRSKLLETEEAIKAELASRKVEGG